jgi:hypothetical protein
MEYFDYCHGLTMTSRVRLFFGNAAQNRGPITQRAIDIAASIQQ